MALCHKGFLGTRKQYVKDEKARSSSLLEESITILAFAFFCKGLAGFLPYAFELLLGHIVQRNRIVVRGRVKIPLHFFRMQKTNCYAKQRGWGGRWGRSVKKRKKEGTENFFLSQPGGFSPRESLGVSFSVSNVFIFPEDTKGLIAGAAKDNTKTRLQNLFSSSAFVIERTVISTYLAFANSCQLLTRQK